MTNKNDFTIPERLYYPISEAAKKLNCSISDVIHMGATGVLNFSIYLPAWQESEKDRFNVFTFSIDESEKQGSLRGKGWSISGIYHEKIDGEKDRIVSFARSLNGFFSLSAQNLIELEFDVGAPLFKVNSLKVRTNETEVDEILIHSFYGVMLPVKNLCIMASDMDDINTRKGELPESDADSAPKRVNTNKQAKMIKALIEILYGKGASERARSLLNTERDNGEMLADFDAAGIRPPVSGKVLAEWIKEVDLEYVDKSTVK